MSEESAQSVEVISNLLGLTTRRVQQLAKDGVIPKSQRGKYPLVGSIKGYIEFLRSQLPNSGKPVADLRAETSRLKAAQANLAEMEVAQQKGRLLDAETVYQQDFEVMRTLRDSLFSLPPRLAPVLHTKKTAKEIHNTIRKEIEDSILKILQKMELESTKALGDLNDLNDLEIEKKGVQQ